MVKRVTISIIVAYFVSLPVLCQSNDSVQIIQKPIDSLAVTSGDTSATVIRATDWSSDDLSAKDTVVWMNDKMEIDKSTQKLLESTKPFKPDPTKAVIYSAVFPGLGQIYNRKYWKLPIVYGGFLGFVYAITWNGRMYSDYTDGYKAIMSDDYASPEKSKYWTVFFSEGALPENLSDISTSKLTTYREQMRSRRDFNRRNRDLSIIGAVAMYVLCMIDAYVDAQLYDFDISPDLSFRVEPKMGIDAFSQKSFGLQCSVKF